MFTPLLGVYCSMNTRRSKSYTPRVKRWEGESPREISGIQRGPRVIPHEYQLPFAICSSLARHTAIIPAILSIPFIMGSLGLCFTLPSLLLPPARSGSDLRHPIVFGYLRAVKVVAKVYERRQTACGESLESLKFTAHEEAN